MARKISVEIVGDSRSLERAFARSSRAGEKFNRSMTTRFTGTAKGFSSLARSLPVIGGAFGGAAIVGGIEKTIDAASNLNEQMNRSRVVFGRSAESITSWSTTTATAIGLSQAAALEAASNFGAMFNTIGLGNRESAAMSKRLTVLGADLASFNNQDPTEMLDRLRSGLAGEAEPLRRFGILLSEGRVKQEAYRSGIAKAGAELTEQQKVQARFNLILRDTARQQGDFARTSGGLANQQRILKAQIGNLSTELGTALLPVVTDVVSKFNEWLSDPGNKDKLINNITTSVGLLADGFDALATAVGIAADAYDKLRSARESAAEGFGGGDPTGIGHFLFMGPGELLAQLGNVPWKKAGEDAGEKFTTGFVNSVAVVEHLAEVARAHELRPFTPDTTPDPKKKPPRRRGEADRRAQLRNTIFDAAIARRLNRLQDLNLRGQLAGLRAIAQTIRARISVTKDATRRLTLEDQLLDVLREQRSVQEEIGSQVKATNQALQERADAIKSAVLDRLQQRQNQVLNNRELRDAKERLRVAKLLGGPAGARLARENLQNVLFERTRLQLEAAPARLTKGGQLTLGNVVTINIHGVTDPNAVAIKVDEILKRRARRSSNPTRGAAAGSSAGQR